MFFNDEKVFEKLFCICIQLLNKTWREMRASEEDFPKVYFNIIMSSPFWERHINSPFWRKHIVSPSGGGTLLTPSGGETLLSFSGENTLLALLGRHIVSPLWRDNLSTPTVRCTLLAPSGADTLFLSCLSLRHKNLTELSTDLFNLIIDY